MEAWRIPVLACKIMLFKWVGEKNVSFFFSSTWREEYFKSMQLHNVEMWEECITAFSHRWVFSKKNLCSFFLTVLIVQNKESDSPVGSFNVYFYLTRTWAYGIRKTPTFESLHVYLRTCAGRIGGKAVGGTKMETAFLKTTHTKNSIIYWLRRFHLYNE